jgi:hypothetical protein
MKFLFDDETFSFETLRSTGFASYFGADLGEVLATAARIKDGDLASWQREWKATAGRVAELGERSLAAGHRISARENLLRASNYIPHRGRLSARQPRRQPGSRRPVRRAGRHLRRGGGPAGPPARGGVYPVSGHDAARLAIPGR